MRELILYNREANAKALKFAEMALAAQEVTLTALNLDNKRLRGYFDRRGIFGKLQYLCGRTQYRYAWTNTCTFFLWNSEYVEKTYVRPDYKGPPDPSRTMVWQAFFSKRPRMLECCERACG